jgi:hypothetical protein
MNKIKIKMTEAELRALAWEEDSNPMAYRVARADVYDCEAADGGRLVVLPCDWDNTYYGASAKLPDGRTLYVAVGEAGDDLQITVGYQDAEIDLGDDPTIDWADVTGCPIADTDADERKRKAVRAWVRDLYAHNGIILHYRDTLYIGQARCNDGWRDDHDYAAELDVDEAGDAMADALCGDGDAVDAGGLDGRSWCGQIGDDLTRNEAIDAARAQLECDPDATSAPVDYVPISCYQCDDYGTWMWWHAGDAVRDCVITRDDLDDEEA